MYIVDDFIAMGTVRDLARKRHVSERAIWNKTYKGYQKKFKDGTAVIRIEDEENDD
ncbi:hypothetical protein FC35_GL001739 [Limosilactobacillus coleohominis DSM 14060]|nr:hypothetical protein FC35_GL001739 [Limosilactobacillus coleohominis DSM 14060]